MGCVSRYGKLPLADSPRTNVFRCIDDILRADPVLTRVIKPVSFRSWRGDPNDQAEFARDQAPALRIMPIPGPEQSWYPGTQRGDLIVRVELFVASPTVDDVENLFFALEVALVPRDHTARLAQQARLKAAGSMLGDFSFAQPAFDPAPAGDGLWRAVGLFKTEVKTT